MRKIELLAPAGTLEKLQVALHYGADAVYAGGDAFGLRARAGNFDLAQLAEARRLTRQLGRRLYLTLNAYLRPAELPALEQYLEALRPLDLDAYIVADPGVLATVRRVDPARPLHLSTQANTTNGAAARFWQQQGVARVNLARELSLADIAAVRREAGLELEAFVHGAMCVAYSGRCLLSSALTGRSANQGDCAHACRWRYHLVEETRPGQYLPLEQDGRGTYLFNSRDLCLVEELPALLAAGVDSLKIEGRMKTPYYVAAVTRVYRAALDAWLTDPHGWQLDPRWREELDTVSHRPYDTGFLRPQPDAVVHDADSHYSRNADFLGLVRRGETGRLRVEVRNRFLPGEALELIGPGMRTLPFVVAGLTDADGGMLSAAQPNMRVCLDLPAGAAPGDLLRRRPALSGC